MSATADKSNRLPTYRALRLGEDGSVIDIEPLIAADDDQAKALAKAMVNGHAVELWDGLRYVEHFTTGGQQP